MQPLGNVSSLEEEEYYEELWFIASGLDSFACRLQYPSHANTNPNSHTDTRTYADTHSNFVTHPHSNTGEDPAVAQPTTNDYRPE